MSFSDYFTQGGQTTLHKFRMMSQIIKVTFFSCLALAGGWMYMTSSNSLSDYEIYCVYMRGLTYATEFVGGKKLEFKDQYGVRHDFPIQELKKHRTIQESVDKFCDVMVHDVFGGLLIGVISFFVISGGWIITGYQRQKKKHLKGMLFMSERRLKKLLRSRKQASHITIGGMPLVKDSETSHIMMCGTTGTGKSTAILSLLSQIRKNDQKTLVVDMNGEFVSRFYRPGIDTILNPFDQRSKTWNLWDECQESYHFDDFAASLIPEGNTHDPFWVQAARVMLSVGAQRQTSKSHEELMLTLISKPLSEIQDIFKGTEAAALTHKEGEKTVASIRATLTPYVKSLKLFDSHEGSFSLKAWAERDDDTSWVFLTAIPDQREMLRPLISSWVHIAMSSLMSQPPSQDRRTWFILDELPALNKLSSLSTGLAEMRKYGGCIVAGIQDIGQLRQRYGHQTAQSVLGLFNTKLLFRTTDPDTAQWMSRALGEQQVSETQESISFGANQIRDGVSINEQKQTQALVMPTELMTLDNLSAYLRLSGNWPLTKVKIPFKKYDKHQESFLRR